LKVVYGHKDPNEQISALNSLITKFLDRHAPLRRIKMTRTPAPWLNDPGIRSVGVTARSPTVSMHGRHFGRLVETN